MRTAGSRLHRPSRLAGAARTAKPGAWIGGAVAGLGTIPTVLIVAFAAALFTLLTEFTLNTATATMAMPIMAGAAMGLGVGPVMLIASAGSAWQLAIKSALGKEEDRPIKSSLPG